MRRENTKRSKQRANIMEQSEGQRGGSVATGLKGVQTGYFGKIVGRDSCKVTKSHAVRSNGRPVCGSVIGTRMRWHFCAPGFHWEYVDCERCKAWYRRQQMHKEEA